jgi:hypothetical protein
MFADEDMKIRRPRNAPTVTQLLRGEKGFEPPSP